MPIPASLMHLRFRLWTTKAVRADSRNYLHLPCKVLEVRWIPAIYRVLVRWSHYGQLPRDAAQLETGI